MSWHVACQGSGLKVVSHQVAVPHKELNRTWIESSVSAIGVTETAMSPGKSIRLRGGAFLILVLMCLTAWADEPQPKPENTVHVELTEPVKPQAFARPLKFFVGEVTDRSGNAQPMLVLRMRGGIFLDRTPVEITREGLTNCLKSADMLAADRESADFILSVYLFHFGLSDSSGMDFFGKVEFAVMVKNAKTGKSQQIQASGTSIAGGAFRKKNLQKNVLENINTAFGDAVRNLLRGQKLKDAVSALDVPVETNAPAEAPPAAEKPPARRWN